jgi:uncharacterized membrane protein
MENIVSKVGNSRWLFLVFCAAIGLRLVNIGSESLWLDEAISYLAATLPISLIVDNSVQSSHPPLYYLLLKAVMGWLPDSDGALRLLGTGWNLLLLPLIYWLAIRQFGERSYGWWAFLLVAISPFHLLYSHELRMYTQLMTLAVLTVACFWQAWHTDSWRWWAGFGVCALLAVYTHLFAWLVLAGIGLFSLLRWWRDGRFRWGQVMKTAVIIFLLLLLFVPWLNIMLFESRQDLGSLRPLHHDMERDWLKPLIAPAFLLFGMSFNLIYTGLALFLVVATGLVLLLELRKVWRETGIPPAVQLTGLIVLCVLGIPLLVHLIRPFFLPERTLAAASPFIILLLAWATSRRQTPLPYLVGATAVLMLAGSILYHMPTAPSIKPPYRDAVQFVESQRQPNEAVVHTSDGSYLPALRYIDRSDHVHILLAGDPDPRKPRWVYEAVGGTLNTTEQLQAAERQLWLIVALEHSIEWQQEQVALLTQAYTLQAEYDFAGIQVYRYQAP